MTTPVVSLVKYPLMIKPSPINIVLIEPEIPQNTGNIGRTCVALGAPLILIGPLGFSLEGKDIRRAGLDYWEKLRVERYKDWDEFSAHLPADADVKVLSTKGKKLYWNVRYTPPVYLVFGSESRGLPPSLYRRLRHNLVRIPQDKAARSLNLAVAVGIAAYEAARQMRQSL
ncbi:MAG: tRNA (cytidine(34)-2'-O)-methyltransferase [Elusimicrobia bacterium]|nr:tRNA (cytidine(34)-2'-O)-methyltransferase [Candidatus Obscuribacterium magneticum]